MFGCCCGNPVTLGVTVLKSVFGGACRFSSDCSPVLSGNDPFSITENIDTVYSTLVRRIDLPAFGTFGIDYNESVMTYNRFVYYLTISSSESARYQLHSVAGTNVVKTITRCEPTVVELTETGSNGWIKITKWELRNPITIQQKIALMAAKIQSMQPTGNTFSVLNTLGEPIPYVGEFNSYDQAHYRETARLLNDLGRPWDTKQVANVYVGNFKRPNATTVWERNWGRSTVELIRTTTQTPSRYCVYETQWNVPSYTPYGEPYCIPNLSSSPMTFEPIYRTWNPQHNESYGRWMLAPGQSIAQLGIAAPSCCQ